MWTSFKFFNFLIVCTIQFSFDFSPLFGLTPSHVATSNSLIRSTGHHLGWHLIDPPHVCLVIATGLLACRHIITTCLPHHQVIFHCFTMDNECTSSGSEITHVVDLLGTCLIFNSPFLELFAISQGLIGEHLWLANQCRLSIFMEPASSLTLHHFLKLNRRESLLRETTRFIGSSATYSLVKSFILCKNLLPQDMCLCDST